jgi:hypothetical protein
MMNGDGKGEAAKSNALPSCVHHSADIIRGRGNPPSRQRDSKAFDKKWIGNG